MVKSPFERIFSKIDRKKIFLGLVKSGQKIYLKTQSQNILEFRALSVDETLTLYGEVQKGQPVSFEKVTALFYLNNERYFLITRLKKREDQWSLVSDHQFFRLNRRNAFRTKVPASSELSLFVSAIRNIEVQKKVQILEISSGGARVYWNITKKLPVGTQMKAFVQWGKDKMLPVEALVVHQLEAEIFGLKFINMNPTLQNRLKHLSIDLQMQYESS
jgi:c-di-GMP-binding flagellar brake protein YcgR